MKALQQPCAPRHCRFVESAVLVSLASVSIPRLQSMDGATVRLDIIELDLNPRFMLVHKVLHHFITCSEKIYKPTGPYF